MDFDDYIRRWRLERDGDPIITPASRLLPVRFEGAPAMLKIALVAEERAGANLMTWWAGNGAAEVLAHSGPALLMERATGQRSLERMVEEGVDDAATRIICRLAGDLHQRRAEPLPRLVPLDRWFRALPAAAEQHGGLLAVGWRVARDLISQDREPSILHGDLHHGNVLDFGERGWLAIDPKGLYGERTFDYVNLLRNPDPKTALAPGRFEHQVEVICQAAGLEPQRFLQWTLAFTCLSAAWILADGDQPSLDLAIARSAASRLGVGVA